MSYCQSPGPLRSLDSTPRPVFFPLCGLRLVKVWGWDPPSLHGAIVTHLQNTKSP